MLIITGAGIALERFNFGEAEEVYPEILGAVVPAEVFDALSRLLQQFQKAAASKR